MRLGGGGGALCGLFSHLKGRWSLRVSRGPLARGRLGSVSEIPLQLGGEDNFFLLSDKAIVCFMFTQIL